MKKLLAVLTALLLVTSVAYSLDSMKDSDMDGVAGQAGLSITQYLSTVQVTTTQEGLSWGDDDGENTAGLGGIGAGHLAIRAATAAGLQATMGMTVEISSASPIVIDVDAAGIYLQMAAINVTVNTAPRMQFSVSGNTVSDFAGVLQADTTKVLGDMATDNMGVAVSMPSVLRIAPH